ncbi:MAG: O-antigen ligase family protein, partial [Patescibacteria group bacterium]
AYGTFPHPNVLAAFLMMALWVVGWLWMRHGGNIINQKSNIKNLELVWPATTALLLWGLYLTFSRTVIAVWLAASIAIALVLVIRRISGRWPNIKTIRRRALPMAITVFAVSACFAVFMWPTVVARMTISSSDEAVTLRIKYNDDAVASGVGQLWRINWTGVGIGNFTTWLARYDTSMPSFMYQPAHNIYLMIYSETGFISLLLWFAWLALIIRTALLAHSSQPVVRVGVLVLLSAVLMIGLLDHFYWTLQQGRILWWSALALAAGRV